MVYKPRLEARIEPRTTFSRTRSKTVTNVPKESDAYNEMDATLFGDYPTVSNRKEQVNWHEFLMQIDNHMAKQSYVDSSNSVPSKKAKEKVKSVSSSSDLFNKYSRKSPMTSVAIPKSPGGHGSFPGTITNQVEIESFATKVNRDSAISAKSGKTLDHRSRDSLQDRVAREPPSSSGSALVRKASMPIVTYQSAGDGTSWEIPECKNSQPIKHQATASRPPIPAGVRLDRRFSLVRANAAGLDAPPGNTTRRVSALSTPVSDMPPQVGPVPLALPNLHVPILLTADSKAYVEEQRRLAGFKNMLGGYVQFQKELETGIYTSIWANDPLTGDTPSNPHETEFLTRDSVELPKSASKKASLVQEEPTQSQITAQESFQKMKETIERISKQEQYQMCYKGTKPNTTRLRSLHARQAQFPPAIMSKTSPQIKTSSTSHSISASSSSRRTTGAISTTHVRSSSTETINSNFSIPRSPKSRSASYSPSEVALLGGEHERALRNTLASKSRQMLLSSLSFAGEMLIPHDL